MEVKSNLKFSIFIDEHFVKPWTQDIVQEQALTSTDSTATFGGLQDTAIIG